MNVCVFCGSSDGNPIHREQAYELGKMIAQKGHRLVYGGSDRGLMGCVARGAKAAGGEILSIVPPFFAERGISDPYADRSIAVSSMGERKETMIAESDLFIALPGGIGTLDEIGDVLTQVSLQKKDARLILCDFDGFYSAFAVLVERMKEDGYVPPSWPAEPIYAKSLSEIEPLL